MNILGKKLNLMMGPTVPLPAMSPLGESFESAEIINSDDSRSGFQITFKADRRGPLGLLDYPIMKSPQLKVFNRVVITAVLGLPIPKVLLDGIITNRQLTAGRKGEPDKVVITGEDVSVMMDMKEEITEHPAQPEAVIAAKIIAAYAQYGLIPVIIPPVGAEPPNPLEYTPVQHGTDLKYLKDMAARYGYVFYIKAGPVPGVNTAYWGPPKRIGIPQPALTVNMGEHANVDYINFSHDGLSPALVKGSVQDRRLNVSVPVMTFMAKRVPPFAREPSLLVNALKNRQILPRTDGMTSIDAMGRAQGITDASVDNVVTAEGELDTSAYGSILEARGIVGVRGAGESHDGLYYVKKIRHFITRETYSQNFTLTREGMGTITPVVVP